MTETSTATEGPPDSTEASAAELARAKKERIGRYVAIVLMPFLMVGMMVTGYLASMHAPTPHDMPIAVAGPAQPAQEFADALTAADPSAVDVRVIGSDAEARQAVLDREVAGAVVLSGTGDGTATMYTAGAAGASQVSTVTGLVAPQAFEQAIALQNQDLAPLPERDSAGLAAMFMTTALMLAGYMPLSIMLSNSPELLRVRRFVPLLAGWAALVAGLVWLIAGPILGALDGNTAAILGISWLAVFAVGLVQLFLTRILGPMAVLAGMLFLMVLGVPASNMGMSVHTMPSLYATLHNFLPTPATGEALRSVIYFGGNGVGTHVAVLAVGGLVAFAATLGIDALKRRRNPEAGDPEVTMPSITAGPRPTSNRVRYALLGFFPVAMVVMMLSLMLGAMYQPAPKDMPVAVVAASTEQSQQMADGLERSMPGLFDLTVSGSIDDAREQIEDRTLVAAYVLPSAENPSATLVTNEAAGMSQQQVVQQVFGQVSAGQGMPLQTETVASLGDGDTMGTVSLYLAMGWIMSGFMVVVVAFGAAPMVMPLRKLVPVVAGFAVFMSTVLWVIADPIVGAVDGHFLPLVGTGIVAIVSVALFTTVFVRLLGVLAVLPAVAVLMFLGVPASGGALSIYMEPTIFRFLHDVLPMPAAVESVRSILYFGGDTVGSHLLTFVIWGAVSLLCVAIIDRFRPVRTQPLEVEAERVPVTV